MPVELSELSDLKLAEVRSTTVGGVDWDGLFDALCELGFGENGTGFSAKDVHLITRQFATVEYDPKGYPISRQRVYKWVMEKYKLRQAIRFAHANAADHRFAFQKQKLDPTDPALKDFVYQGE